MEELTRREDKSLRRGQSSKTTLSTSGGAKFRSTGPHLVRCRPLVNLCLKCLSKRSSVRGPGRSNTSSGKALAFSSFSSHPVSKRVLVICFDKSWNLWRSTVTLVINELGHRQKQSISTMWNLQGYWFGVYSITLQIKNKKSILKCVAAEGNNCRIGIS